MSNKSNNPVLNTVLGIVALLCISFLANWLISLSSLGNRTLDLTEDKVHTLTEGTKSILQDLKNADAEVVINYYATRDSDYMPRQLELYMKKVDDFLKRYQALAGENLRIVHLDPEPDTDAEDSANLDGIAGQTINGENIYLGISVSSLDQKASIAYLAPSAEPQLEYQLSSAIARVARTDRSTLGFISSFPLAGQKAQPSMGGMPPRPAGPPFIIYSQLQQFYELKDLGMEPEEGDLEGLSAILVIHPTDLSPKTEYLLDQYLLKGGTIVGALDAYSLTAQQLAQQFSASHPMLGPQEGATSSTFSPQLLDSWGVNFESSQVVADGKYRTRLQQEESTAVLSLTKEAMPIKDSLITNQINELFFILCGGLTNQLKDGLAYTSLLRTTTEAGLVDGQRASRLDPSLLRSMRPDENAYDLAVHITGQFKSAFPDGEPAEEKEEGEGSATAEAEAAEGEASDDSLKESSAAGNVFLIADTDFLADNFAYRQIFGGMVSPQGDNAAFLFNILDQVTGSKHLIGARSRGDSRRPFTVIQEMESDFEQEFGEKFDKEQQELTEIEARINELIQGQQDQGQIVLEGDLAEELENAREKQVEARKRLRELEKGLRRDKDELAARYTRANVFIIPLLVIIIGICVYAKRRVSTSAR